MNLIKNKNPISGIFLSAVLVILQLQVAPAQPAFVFHVADSLRQSFVLKLALEDVQSLLKQAFPHASFRYDGRGDVHFVLLLKTDSIEEKRFSRPYPMASYPPHSYTWQGGDGFYQLTAPSVEGLQFGLYGFLQDQLGFRFYHPRESVIPHYGKKWPLSGSLTYTARPVFHKRGFHLHTTHPLELTEAFHGTGFSGGLKEIREYIDWLCRNGQNYFDFTLMRRVDLDTWPRYAAAFVDYAHQRGLLVGLELSLHMVQQQVFQLIKYPHHSLSSFKNQINRNLEKLFQARWDFLNLDLTTAEFFGGMDRQKTRLKYHLVRRIRDVHGAQVLLRKHVVNEENHVGQISRVMDVTAPEDHYIGILLHTVMFYSLTDSLAPVYENRDFSHVLRDLVKENQRRETWYYPESAYWITFDNSVPMLLLPYLKARHADIRTCDSLGIPNHVTFSSGWEWGYWLVDWCIARWSWKVNDALRTHAEPLQLLFGPETTNHIMHAEELQAYYMKALNLMRYLCPLQTIDELPRFLRKQFQPRPAWEPRALSRANGAIRKEVELVADQLDTFGLKLKALADSLNLIPQKLLSELADALTVTALRAAHRAQTLRALLNRKKDRAHTLAHLKRASDIRRQAQNIVYRRETFYRYSLADLARPHPSPTAYPYGYLWPVHTLHFWLREEEQIRRGRFGPFFMNIWPLGPILGLD